MTDFYDNLTSRGRSIFLGSLLTLGIGYVAAHYIPTGTRQIRDAEFVESGDRDDGRFLKFRVRGEPYFVLAEQNKYGLDTLKRYNLEVKTTLLGADKLSSLELAECVEESQLKDLKKDSN